MPDFILSMRAPDGSGPAQKARYLRYDEATAKELAQKDWVAQLTAGFPKEVDPTKGPVRTGEILFLVHGFNQDQNAALALHREIQEQLSALGWNGALISYDWYSDGLVFAYLDDRAHARAAASELVSAGIALLEDQQSRDCPFTVHVLTHSMGAFVLQQAFAWSYQDVPAGWKVGQIVMVAGDLDYTVLEASNYSAKTFVQHAARLTAYCSRYDKALAVSNAKRLDLAPRVGRVGLPADAPSMMCEVDCSAMFADHYRDIVDRLNPVKTHSFYFGERIFWQDVVLTLAGGIDRDMIKTRAAVGPLANRFSLNLQPLADDEYARELASASNVTGTARPSFG
ncbi:MAG TPA: alpha/beta hydrolase [Allosphingosinicella sp.]|nr:alpha/beta hydrolase [Allosphingosinicella sp.]